MSKEYSDQRLLVQLGTSALIFAKVPAVLLRLVLASLSQTSTLWSLSSQEVCRPHYRTCWLSSLHRFPFTLRPDKSKGMKKRHTAEVFSWGYSVKAIS